RREAVGAAETLRVALAGRRGPAGVGADLLGGGSVGGVDAAALQQDERVLEARRVHGVRVGDVAAGGVGARPGDFQLLEAAQVRRLVDRERDGAGVDHGLGRPVGEEVPRDHLRWQGHRTRRRWGGARQSTGRRRRSEEEDHCQRQALSHQASAFGRRRRNRMRVGGAARTISNRIAASTPSSRLAAADRYGTVAGGPSAMLVLLATGAADAVPLAFPPGPAAKALPPGPVVALPVASPLAVVPFAVPAPPPADLPAEPAVEPAPGP